MEKDKIVIPHSLSNKSSFFQNNYLDISSTAKHKKDVKTMTKILHFFKPHIYSLHHKK